VEWSAATTYITWPLENQASKQVAFNQWVWQSHKLTIKIQ